MKAPAGARQIVGQARLVFGRTFQKHGRTSWVLLFVVLWQLVGWPPLWHVIPGLKHAAAAGYTMQTGYYIGNGSAGHAITGLGFQPNLVMVKDDTANGTDGVDWTSSAMATGTTAKTSDADVDVTGGTDFSSLDADGFTVGTGADVNASGVRFTYVAFGGSNCSSSGTFCVGSYSGSGTSGKAVTVGFQPDVVWVKRSGATAGVFRTSSMPANYSQFFANTAQNTSGAEFQSLSTTGFTVGTNAAVNTSGSTYWYAAFKKVSGTINVGSFSGTGAAHSITGMGFAPSFVMFKNATASTAQAAGYNVVQSDGDDSSSFLDSANITGAITTLDSGGFSVGTNAAANGSGNTIYWIGFGGSAAASGSGTFSVANGSYTGTGAAQSITGVGFSPSVVIVGTDGQDDAFRTSLMKGDDTAVFSSGVADFTGGITSLDTDGFSIGTSATTNAGGSTYYWTAYGNAWNPESRTGAADFAIGAYTGSGTTRTVLNLPFKPDLVTVKREGTSAAAWSTSGMTAGTTQYFGATAQGTSGLLTLSANPTFGIGTNASVNTSGSVYNWFAFKDGPNFATGSYTGNGSSQTISGLGFQPDMIWGKRTTAVAGAFTMSSVPSGTSLRYGTNTNSTSDFTSLTSDGFTLGNGAEANTSGGTYWYVAWQGKAYEQKDWRAFMNTDSSSVGATLAAQDSTATLRATSQPFRLRALVRVDSDTLAAGGQNFKLQYAAMSGACDTSFSGESYADVTTSSTIAYYNNPTPSDGQSLIADANDPTDGTTPITAQTYDEANPATSTQAVSANQDGEWDFSLADNGAPPNSAYCLRIVSASGSLLANYSSIPEIITSDGLFNVDVVDTNGNSVSNPSASLVATGRSFQCVTTTGTLGLSSQHVRLRNHTANPKWTLSIAATSGSTALWSSGSAYYDFNDTTGSTPGCAAGVDSDAYAGDLSVDPTTASITPESACSANGLALGAPASFNEGVTDAITLITASSSATNGCYWDLAGFHLSQTIPGAQPVGSYSLGLTLTAVAN